MYLLHILLLHWFILISIFHHWLHFGSIFSYFMLCAWLFSDQKSSSSSRKYRINFPGHRLQHLITRGVFAWSPCSCLILIHTHIYWWCIWWFLHAEGIWSRCTHTPHLEKSFSFTSSLSLLLWLTLCWFYSQQSIWGAPGVIWGCSDMLQHEHEPRHTQARTRTLTYVFKARAESAINYDGSNLNWHLTQLNQQLIWAYCKLSNITSVGKVQRKQKMQEERSWVSKGML